MLGKLIKNEWISTWKVPTILCAYIGILTLIGCVSFLSPIWNSNNYIINSLLVISAVIYFLSLFATIIIIFIYFIVRFYRNMYTDEGYLMHTLPVTAHQHLISKGLIFLIWGVLSTLAVIASVAAIVLTIIASTGEINLGDGFHAFNTYIIPTLMKAYYQEFSVPFSVLVIWTILLALAQSIHGILMIYGAISIGQTFHKYRVMASVGAYFALSIIIQTVTSLVSLPLLGSMIESTDNIQKFILTSYGFSTVMVILTTVGFYFLSAIIMKKQLNLE